jgi:putative membrane protein
MFANAAHYLNTLPLFLLYFAVAIAISAAYLAIYSFVTPYAEWTLIRNGNNAAAIGLSGAIIGFVIPLASTISQSLSLTDMVVWGVVAMIVQLLVYLIARICKPHLNTDIEAGRTAPAVLLAALSVAVGILNAACMTY